MSTLKVWSRLSATKKSVGTVFKFRFQEATANDKEEVLNFLGKHLIVEERFFKGSGIPKSKEAIEDILGLFSRWYENFHIMVCYEDKESTNEPIIGLSMVNLEKEDDEEILPKILSKVKTAEVRKLFNIIQVTEELCNARKKLKLDKYYAGSGVIVHSAYAGLGIATEFLRLRRVVSKEHGVPATGAWMTAIGSQKAAERDGWKTVFEIPFDELARLTECNFDGAPPICKLMVGFAET